MAKRKGSSKAASSEERDAALIMGPADDAASIPYPEIAVELGIPKREVLRWAKGRARGKTFRSSPEYLAWAIEVERRYRLFDWTLYCTSEKYRDAIFKNARRGTA
jgi:hypothetical protein